MTVEELMAKAEETNRQRDAIDRRNGFAAPSDGPAGITMRTVVEAIWAGLRMDDRDCVAEGLAMLGDVTGYRPWGRQ